MPIAIISVIFSLMFFIYFVAKIKYRKIPNISPELINICKQFLGGLYSGGLDDDNMGVELPPRGS